MNAAGLLQHFERISEAPDTVPRLRQFILDLAVRGKLVEQDPKDEPASELLKRIQTEKVRLVKEGNIRKQPLLPAVDPAITPFLVPKHWAWLQLSGIGVLSGGMTPSKNRSEFWGGNINWFSPKDMKSDELVNSELKITAIGMAETGLQLYPPGCLFMVARSGILKRTFPVSINRVEATANQDLKVLTPFVKGLERYFQVMFRGMTGFILSALVKTGTTVQSLKYEEFESQPFPLPPLAEQQRIVAKVDELMALCDRLVAARAEQEIRRDRLVVASLQRLNNGADAHVFREHARFHFRHLPRLTTRPEHIRQLRQTILNLTVRGRLVPQDPNEESAAELLKRIAEDKARLVKAGLFPRPRATIGAPKLTFQPPTNWQTIHFGDVCNLVTSGSRGWAEFYADSGPKFIRAQNIRFGRLRPNDLACVNPPASSEGKRTQVKEGDLVIVITGAGVTNPAQIDRDLGEAYVSQHVALIKPTTTTLSRWLLLCLMSGPSGRNELVERAYGAGKPGLNLDNIRSLNIPLPPLAEQQRIVAKVDELMALCDQLEIQLTTNQTDSRRLLEATLSGALAA